MMKFGEYLLDIKHSRLLNASDNAEKLIEPKVFELLLLFVERPNAVISRKDILEQLWSGSLVTDNAINKLIGNLRKALGDEAKNPRYIQTVPKRGYRLVCQVTTINDVTPKSVKKDPLEGGLLSINVEPNKLKMALNPKLKSIFIVVFVLLLFIGWNIESTGSDVSTGYTIALTRDQGVELSPKVHPDNEHLYYLKDSIKSKKRELWFKNINTAVTKRVEIYNHINDIIAVTTQSENTKLIFIENEGSRCFVNQALISHPGDLEQTVLSIETLFDCSNKRVKDIDYHKQKNVLYYTAQPKNFWPNHIYTFDIESQKHSLVTQIEPIGWGHHTIDISPDGEKLLIMSTNNDHKTQLLVLNLVTNKLTEGMKFDRPVYEAIWHHDSEQVFYYSPPPAHQIIKSKYSGNDAAPIISVSEELSAKMSRVPDNKNLVFTTENKNFDNRWLVNSSNSRTISNSNVADSNPALFHSGEQYLFSSKRTGRMQLYLGDNKNEDAKIVTNFSKNHSLGYMSMAPDDSNVLLALDEKVYLIPLSDLSSVQPITSLKPEYLVYTSEVPIISLDWQGNHGASITIVQNGIPELIIVDLSDKKIKNLQGKWAYGVTDIKQLDFFYVIEQQSNRLFQLKSTVAQEQSAIHREYLMDTKIVLPKEFYLAKIDNKILYYVTSENNLEYLHTVPLANESLSSKTLLNPLSRYDVSHGKIMLSDMVNQEGDIYSTVY